ncbi:heavy metal-binding domain-containing protein [Flavobacterium sp.]|uniref:heavy metal-binding domain-containing protein n=1 Tax=Flavobacterium sp. TaxID=239 RepID=UPI00375215E3
MKNLIIVLSVFLTVITATTAQTATKKESPETMYACPMHPYEMSAKEGKCSKCEMKMVKTSVSKHSPAIKGSQTKHKVVTKYVCAMDGATSDKPCNCPKCGKEMTKQEAQKMTYACPMHPNEMSMKEGECSKCGMKLVKTELKYNSAVKGTQSSSVVTTKYVCKMDGETSDKPGKCAKCGMDMTPKVGVNK